MALGGFVCIAGIFFFVLYLQSKQPWIDWFLQSNGGAIILDIIGLCIGFAYGATCKLYFRLNLCYLFFFFSIVDFFFENQ